MKGIQYSYHFGFKNAFCNLDLQYIEYKQAEKLKSRDMKEGWRIKNDNDDFKLLRGFNYDRLMVICECRVAFATENHIHIVQNRNKS